MCMNMWAHMCAMSALKSIYVSVSVCMHKHCHCEHRQAYIATGASQCDCHKPGKHRDRFSMACVMFFCTFRDLMSLSPISRRGSHDRCSSPSRRLISFCMKKVNPKTRISSRFIYNPNSSANLCLYNL